MKVIEPRDESGRRLRVQVSDMPEEIQDLEDQLDAAERDARTLAAGLTEERGTWREGADSWSVAECLDHLANANRIYLDVMEDAALRAREQGRRRRGPALAGFIGRWFVSTLGATSERPLQNEGAEHCPAKALTLGVSLAKFTESQDRVRAFLRRNAGLDLSGVRFANPFVPGVRFSLATGLNIITAHERRHLWQAWRARQAAELNVGVNPLSPTRRVALPIRIACGPT